MSSQKLLIETTKRLLLIRLFQGGLPVIGLKAQTTPATLSGCAICGESHDVIENKGKIFESHDVIEK